MMADNFTVYEEGIHSEHIQRWKRSWSETKWRGDLALDSPLTSQARCLWSVNEAKTVNSMVSLANFLSSSGIHVIEDRIGTSKRPRALWLLYLYSSTGLPLAMCSVLDKIQSGLGHPAIVRTSFYKGGCRVDYCRDHGLCGGDGSRGSC